eukprot:TRINITY_DN247_c0_g1_i1.p1 TRINITY_DN247_c0_g1~~TRINITY_DN247_c0_g1_i1.p1  ORF type:complete len:395 (+),score=131.32 TRINITY_DN247_c0_g1_i1:63-1247(+)
MMRCGLLLAAACAVSGLSLSPATDKVVKDEFILLLHSNITVADHDALNERVKGKKFSIGKGFRAVHATLNEESLEWVLAQEHLVKKVEHNQVVRLVQETCNAQQRDASWGQARTTNAGPQNVVNTFAHNPDWGKDIDIYIVDTGIRCTHVDFKDTEGESRCLWGANTAGGSNTDVNGHGTHCASTSGGIRYGIAKASTLIAVKVLGDNGSGTTAGVIAGVQFVADNAATRKKKSVANMSLGGGFSTASNNAVDAAVGTGVSFAVAAGNDNADARNYSPASAKDCVTVGSTELANSGGTQVDARSSFSNYGSTLDIFAPGSNIVAAYSTSDTAYATLSGTSMASPHVAGAMALYAQTNSPAEVKKLLNDNAETGILQIGTGSPNKMLHVPCISTR